MVRVVAVHPATAAYHKRQRVYDVVQRTVLKGQGGVEAIDVKGSKLGVQLPWSFRNAFLGETSEDTRPEVGVAVENENGPMVRRVSFQRIKDATCSTPSIRVSRCTTLDASNSKYCKNGCSSWRHSCAVIRIASVTHRIADAARMWL